ncbi:hypothetical protein BBD42_09190 [Paenibacillus sp. BIHB 4019]|uniref:Regulatory protein YycH domain-containing protein n=1 Tax=Paenibacillus sp. BIHB 4019 TaxID=1870819 RepID=A0A1B2DFX4_9BACL|nr:two-component system activity regulator YycH [Paenibacillus sp. BIHB 4019]ANY66612.1 hypothetical protein BBD42_09190 [Paenibacillus sp. BIHB 4019]
MERAKTMILIFLVAFSLMQSYFLAYSMPGLGATVRTEQDYINAEPLGEETTVENVIFPDELIIHFGGDKHTVLYPGMTFYNMILKDRIQGREFKGFQRSPIDVMDWEQVRKKDAGVELRFQNGVPVDLLRKLLKVQGDIMFLNETIDRIWIFKTSNTEEVRTFFFSADGDIVYESVQADLTVRDVQDYVGFGEYQTNYQYADSDLYIPDKPLQSVEMVYPYTVYSADVVQRNLFFDPGTTKALKDRSGAQIYTDGKRGLQVEQSGNWMIYTDPAASKSADNILSDNMYAAVEFVNQHGGWDGTHRFVNPVLDADSKLGRTVLFQQYLEQYPVLETASFQYGWIRLILQQGVVTEYNRSLITLGDQAESREPRYLPGGDDLRNALEHYARLSEVVSLFPALQAVPKEGSKLDFVPVWGVKLADGTQEVLMEAYPTGYIPLEATNGAEGTAGAAK